MRSSRAPARAAAQGRDSRMRDVAAVSSFAETTSRVATARARQAASPFETLPCSCLPAISLRSFEESPRSAARYAGFAQPALQRVSDEARRAPRTNAVFRSLISLEVARF